MKTFNTETEYVELGVRAFSLEFKEKEKEDRELKAQRECGLYSSVEFVQLGNHLRIKTTLTEKGVEYFTKLGEDRDTMTLDEVRSKWPKALAE